MKDFVEPAVPRQPDHDGENARLKQIARILQVETSAFDRKMPLNSPPAADVEAFVNSPEGQSLVTHFLSIKDPAMRERMLSLVVALAQRGE